MKFLVDECLSPELALLARERGYGASTHVTWLGLAATPDWKLLGLIEGEDWTLVTKNSVDFRGPADARAKKGLYAGLELHAGLVCLNGPVGMTLDIQKELFLIALDEIGADPDLVNQALEITLRHDRYDIVRYEIPGARP